MEFKIKTILISIFKLGKIEKLLEQLLQKNLKELPLPQANQITTEVLSTAKDPNNYQDREVQKMNKYQSILK